MNSLPLLRHERADAPLAMREGRVVTVADFLGDADHLAQRLPDRKYVLNFCSDRYRFATTLAAALARGQTTLLPPTLAPDLIEALKAEYPGLYAVSEAAADAGVETIRYVDPAEHKRAEPAVPQFAASQPAVVAFTSGSTGRPVPHLKTWGSLVRSAWAEGSRLALGPGVGIVGTVPPQHMYGLESTLLITWQCALVLHAGRPFYPDDVRMALQQLPGERMLVTTPVHLRALLADDTSLPALKLILCATAPLSDELARATESRFQAPVFEIYGCTEAGQVATRRTLAGPTWRVFADLELQQNASGTWVRGGHVEKEAMLQDVVELIDAQTFTLHGRTSDLVNIAGKRTSLANLNFHLNGIAGVRDGAFFLPDTEHTQAVVRLAAFAVAPELSVEAVLAELRKRIDPAFLPRPLCLVEALPRNATGKLPREALLALWRAHHS
jgi:acyl-coenzyme A synthetase/AMP-(fatty) acid ligase